MSLSSNIKQLRTLKQLSQPKLAEMANVSKGYIYMLESGDMENPSLDVLQKISEALDCTIADLVGAPKTMAAPTEVQIPESLLEFAKAQKKKGDELSEDDLKALAGTQFRGKRPETVEDWAYLYEFFRRNFGD